MTTERCSANVRRAGAPRRARLTRALHFSTWPSALAPPPPKPHRPVPRRRRDGERARESQGETLGNIWGSPVLGDLRISACRKLTRADDATHTRDSPHSVFFRQHNNPESEPARNKPTPRRTRPTRPNARKSAEAIKHDRPEALCKPRWGTHRAAPPMSNCKLSPATSTQRAHATHPRRRNTSASPFLAELLDSARTLPELGFEGPTDGKKAESLPCLSEGFRGRFPNRSDFETRYCRHALQPPIARAIRDSPQEWRRAPGRQAFARPTHVPNNAKALPHDTCRALTP